MKNRRLLDSLSLSETLQLDFAGGLAAAGGGLYVALNHPEAIRNAVAPVSTVIALVVGFGIAAVGVQVAFMDQKFLRKINEIGRDPVAYITPFIFTVLTGTVTALSLVVLAATPETAAIWFFASVSTVASGFAVWTLLGLFYNVESLVSYVRLLQDAADVADGVTRLRGHDRSRGIEDDGRKADTEQG